MPDVFTSPTVQAGTAIAILIVLITAAFWLLARLRDYTTHDQQSASDVLANLEEMRLKGDISEEEFRTIQSATQTGSAKTSPTTVPSASPNPSIPNPSSSATNHSASVDGSSLES